MNSAIDVRHFPDAELMSRAAAAHVVQALAAAVRSRGLASLVLSGGATPRRLYRLLAGKGCRHAVAWDRIFFFWGDERCVPPDHPDSNYRMASEELLSRVPASDERICRIPVELGWRQAARAYEAVLKNFFNRPEAPACPPGCFDLVLLGVGGDGHTASVFPGAPPPGRGRWVVPAAAPAGIQPPRRVTLTPGALSAAERVLFLAAGDKQDIVRRIFEVGGAGAAGYPAATIRARSQVSVFIADRD